MIDFSTNAKTAGAICDRAARLGFRPAIADRYSLMMDIGAADGVNGNPKLCLDRLLNEFDDFSFLHDVSGIYHHIDRTDGKIKNHFLPRCAE